MFARVRGGLTFANVVALMALFIALGGTSVAAVALKKNSVKSKHIAAGAVTSAKVKDASLQAGDFGAGQLPAGAQGPQGAPGTPGARGPDGSPGPQGPRGERGEDGTDGTNGTDGTDGSPDSPLEVLAKLREVDGSGSLLDADLLDGLSSAAFQRRGSSTSCPSGQVMTAIGETGNVTCAADADTTHPTGPAGGDLTGFYPTPTIRAGAVDGTQVEDGTLGQGDLTTTSGSPSMIYLKQTIPEAGCFGVGLSNHADLAVGDLVIPRVTSGDLPENITVMPYVVGDPGDRALWLCNAHYADVAIDGNFTITWRRLR